jgi:hypothetical protein
VQSAGEGSESRNCSKVLPDLCVGLTTSICHYHMHVYAIMGVQRPDTCKDDIDTDDGLKNNTGTKQ